MLENKISVINDRNERLVGIKTAPTIKKEKYSTVILVHGFGATKHESGGMFDRLAHRLSVAGFLVYRFDFAGRGESEGDYSKTSLSALKSDLSAILKFVSSQSRTDAERIALLGQSLGTSTIVSLEPTVKGLILMGSIVHPKEILIKLFGKGYNPKGISTRKTSEGELIQIKPPFWTDFDKYNLLESIAKINCSILFIHGSNDDKVPLSEMNAYFKNARGLKEKVIIEGADHGLQPYQEEMCKTVVRWLKKNL